MTPLPTPDTRVPDRGAVPVMPPTTGERPSERLVRLARAHVERERGRGRGRHGRTRETPSSIDLEPATTHEVVTREMVLALQREVTQLRVRLDALFYLMVGSVLLEVLLRLIGRA